VVPNFFNLLNDQTREASRVCVSLQAFCALPAP